MNNLKKYQRSFQFALSLVVTLSFLLNPLTTLAQDQTPMPFDLSVSPSTAYLKIKPGNVAVHSITLKNNGTTELTVTPSIVSFTADGTTGHPVLSETSNFPYLDTEKTSFDTLKLPSKATARLTLHFSVPATAEDKEYPLTVMFEGIEEGSDTSSLTAVSGRIGSNVIVLISHTGELENRFTVESFGKAYFVDSFSDLEFSPVIKNNSFAAAAASGSATLSNWRGQKIAEYQISPSVILGYSSKQIEPLSDANSATDANSIRAFSYTAPFLLGPYSFSLFLPSGNQENPTYVEQKIIVWAVPFALLAAITITCFALAGYYFYKKKNSSSIY